MFQGKGGTDFEPALLMFTSAMRYKLRANRHKGTWERNTVADLMQKLEEEIVELREAIESGSPVDILMESADVANFSMMVAEAAMRAVTLRTTGGL